MYDQHTQRIAQPLDWHPAKTGIAFLAGFRHIPKPLCAGSVGGVDHGARQGGAAHQPLAQSHPGLVDGLGLQTFGGAKFQGFGVAEQIDRTHLGLHRIRDQPDDPVQPRLPRRIFGKCVAQTAQQLAAVAFDPFSHQAPHRPVHLYL